MSSSGFKVVDADPCLWVQREQVVRQHPQHAKPNHRDSEPTGDAAEGIWQPRCKSGSAKHEKARLWPPDLEVAFSDKLIAGASLLLTSMGAKLKPMLTLPRC